MFSFYYFPSLFRNTSEPPTVVERDTETERSEIYFPDLFTTVKFAVQITLSVPLNRGNQFSQNKESVQVGKDQEKAQSERDSHSKNRGGKKQTNNQALIP